MQGGYSAAVRRRKSLLHVAAVLATTAVFATACAEPSGSFGDYRSKVHETATDVVSAVATAQLTADLFLHHRATQAFTDVVVTNAEKDANSDESTLDSRQPPDQRSDALKNKVDDILQQATSALTDLRVAVRRNDRGGIRSALEQLAKPLQQLQGLSS
jgi:hypothetical protein